MSDAVARNFNGIWVNANGGIHFETDAPSRSEQKPPLKPEYLARWRQRFADAERGLSTTDPTAACLPAGFPRFLNMVFPGEILQAEHQLNWYAEFGEATVRIYLDGRAPPADLQPSYYGYTTGRWEGNALVTKTVGLRGDTLVDTSGIPHSDQVDGDDAAAKGHSGLPRGRCHARGSDRVRTTVVDRQALRAGASEMTTCRSTPVSKAIAIGSGQTATLK